MPVHRWHSSDGLRWPLAQAMAGSASRLRASRKWQFSNRTIGTWLSSARQPPSEYKQLQEKRNVRLKTLSAINWPSLLDIVVVR